MCVIYICNDGNWSLQCSLVHATIKLETECPGRTEKQQVELVFTLGNK